MNILLYKVFFFGFQSEAVSQYIERHCITQVEAPNVAFCMLSLSRMNVWIIFFVPNTPQETLEKIIALVILAGDQCFVVWNNLKLEYWRTWNKQPSNCMKIYGFLIFIFFFIPSALGQTRLTHDSTILYIGGQAYYGLIIPHRRSIRPLVKDTNPWGVSPGSITPSPYAKGMEWLQLL